MSNSFNDSILIGFVLGDIDVENFEKWIYSDKNIEDIAGQDVYCQLISFDYSNFDSQIQAKKISLTILKKASSLKLRQCIENSRQILLRDIADAFSKTELGSGTTLYEASAIDDRLPHEDRMEARKKDLQVRWQNVPDSYIASHGNALFFLDEKGFVFYAPAYMTWALNNYENPELFRESYLDFQLCTNAIKRYLYFTDIQRGVIARFILFMILHSEVIENEDEACKALEKYWIPAKRKS